MSYSVLFSQPLHIDRKRSQALFRTPTTLQPLPPILISLKYNARKRGGGGGGGSLEPPFWPVTGILVLEILVPRTKSFAGKYGTLLEKSVRVEDARFSPSFSNKKT